jgi:hypothetical protein
MSSFRRTPSLKKGDMPSADEHVEESYGHFILTYYYLLVPFLVLLLAFLHSRLTERSTFSDRDRLRWSQCVATHRPISVVRTVLTAPRRH